MSSPAAKPSATSELDRLQREIEEKTLLIQNVRRELILSQITVLELQDTVLQKETDKADAISILGQAEHALESKINYIVELDRVLNEKLAAAQQAAAAGGPEIAARDRIIQDLVEKLDKANREIGATHAMAGNYARDLAQAQETVQQLTRKLEALAKVR
jgi:chromosome segregation ATPase